MTIIIIKSYLSKSYSIGHFVILFLFLVLITKNIDYFL